MAEASVFAQDRTQRRHSECGFDGVDCGVEPHDESLIMVAVSLLGTEPSIFPLLHVTN